MCSTHHLLRTARQYDTIVWARRARRGCPPANAAAPSPQAADKRRRRRKAEGPSRRPPRPRTTSTPYPSESYPITRASRTTHSTESYHTPDRIVPHTRPSRTTYPTKSYHIASPPLPRMRSRSSSVTHARVVLSFAEEGCTHHRARCRQQYERAAPSSRYLPPASASPSFLSLNASSSASSLPSIA